MGTSLEEQRGQALKLQLIQNEEGGGLGTNPWPLYLLSPAILGMYTLMSNKQYYDAICSGEICNTEGISSKCVWGHGT